MQVNGSAHAQGKHGTLMTYPQNTDCLQSDIFMGKCNCVLHVV